MKGKNKIIVLSVFILLFLWKAASILVGYSFILPGPEQVFVAMIALLQDLSFYEAVIATALRSIFGLSLAFLSAFGFAYFAWKHTWFANVFSPVLLLMRSVPNISYILLILYWCSRNSSSIIISFLILFPMIYQTLYEALKELQRSYLNVLKIYPKKMKESILQVYLPLLRPAISASICNGIAMSFKVGVMAEILGQVGTGVGRQMQLARLNFDLVTVMAWTGWIILLLFVSDQILKRLLAVLCRGEVS
ncbi:ABC transporter permease [Merdibacter massiliensis]|uniref:ABC transporter permease n=1 Tax=Merdibacter massiliensis TaxID=1871030 RepID=UPI00096A3A60|nr:ABC transporter permease subunit [Merdibacter massiliensis]